MPTRTKVIEISTGEYAVNIPSKEMPSDLHIRQGVTETADYYPVIVRDYAGRLALSLTHSEGLTPVEAMQDLGLDPWQPIEIQPYGTNIWIRAHKFHGYREGLGRAYGRVFIPMEIVKKLRIRRYQVYPVLIRGYTNIIKVRHMDNVYFAQKIGVSWRWNIPRNIESYPVLKKAFEILPKMLQPFADCVLSTDNIIDIDFGLLGKDARHVSEKLGYAFRNMTVRNYESKESEKPSAAYLQVEIRATAINAFPRKLPLSDETMYIDYYGRNKIMTLTDALKITVRNVSMFFTDSLRNAEKKNKVRFLTEGDEHKKISYGETYVEGRGEIPFYHVDKYVRFRNEYTATHLADGELEYFNERIEYDLKKKDFLEVDRYGNVWIAD